jgi:hypothetical protein
MSEFIIFVLCLVFHLILVAVMFRTLRSYWEVD